MLIGNVAYINFQIPYRLKKVKIGGKGDTLTPNILLHVAMFELTMLWYSWCFILKVMA